MQNGFPTRDIIATDCLMVYPLKAKGILSSIKIRYCSDMDSEPIWPLIPV